MTTTEAIQSRVRQLCARRGLSIQDLAELTGLSKKTLRNLTAGGPDIPAPKLNTIIAICSGLQVTLGAFFASSYFQDLED